MADEELQPDETPDEGSPENPPEAADAPAPGPEDVDELTAQILADLGDQITDSPEPEPAAAPAPQPGPAADNESMAELLGDLEAAITDEATESVESAASSVDEVVASESMALPDFGAVAPQADEPAGINMLNDVELRVQVELGRTLMYVEDVLRLTPESVIELDKAAGDPVDIYVNQRHVARGEVLVLNENFCVRVSEIIHDPGSSED